MFLPAGWKTPKKTLHELEGGAWPPCSDCGAVDSFDDSGSNTGGEMAVRCRSCSSTFKLRTRIGAECQGCNGSGKVKGLRCPSCGGTGRRKT
jgi:DnaJ-class molecular chaperone